MQAECREANCGVEHKLRVHYNHHHYKKVLLGGLRYCLPDSAS